MADNLNAPAAHLKQERHLSYTGLSTSRAAQPTVNRGAHGSSYLGIWPEKPPVQQPRPLGRVLVAAPHTVRLGPQLQQRAVGRHQQRERQRGAVHAWTCQRGLQISGVKLGELGRAGLWLLGFALPIAEIGCCLTVAK
jgi:hypothetical protein